MLPVDKYMWLMIYLIFQNVYTFPYFGFSIKAATSK